MSEDIEKFLTDIAVRFNNETLEKNAEAIEEALQIFPQFPSFSEFYLHKFSNDDEANAIIMTLLKREGLTSNESWRLKALYNNAALIKRIVARHMSDFEGMSCSVDKTRSMLDAYVKYEMTVRKGEKNTPEPELSEEFKNGWYTPVADTHKLWFKFFDGLLVLLSGDSRDFVIATVNLQHRYWK